MEGEQGESSKEVNRYSSVGGQKKSGPSDSRY